MVRQKDMPFSTRISTFEESEEPMTNNPCEIITRAATKIIFALARLPLLAPERNCVIAVTHSADFSEKADVVYRLEKKKLVRV